MAQETVTRIDFNFSNSSGSEQTATISTTLGADNFLGQPVNGSFVTSSSFKNKIIVSNTALTNYLAPFRLVEITESQDSISKSKSYKLQDSITLKLQSIAVLLRGKDVGPKGELDFDDYVENWTELPDEIKYDTTVLSFTTNSSASYGQLPERKGNALIMGQIYNETVLRDKKGEDYSRVYLNGVEKPDLGRPPINDVFQYTYGGWSLPPEDDKGSWQDSSIRLGFTLVELKAALDILGVSHQGIPNNSDYLIDTSGKLIDVVSAAAQQIGYFWYVDLAVPTNPKVRFIDSEAIDGLTPTKYIDTTDQKIISSSYTRSTLKPSKALIYSANLEINEDDPNNEQRTQKQRQLRKLFKRLNLSTKLKNTVNFFLENFYLLWETGTFTEENFKKVFYYGMHESDLFRSALSNINYDDELQDEGVIIDLGSAESAYETMKSSLNRNKGTAAEWKILEAYELAKYFQEPTQKEKNQDSTFEEAYSMLRKEQGLSENQSRSKSILDPSETYVFSLVRLFMETAFGGIYISTPISKYRFERTSFQPDGKYAVLGMFAYNEKLEDIPALKPLGEFLQTFTTGNSVTISDLVKKFYPNVTTTLRYFAIAFENIPEKFKETDKTDVLKVLGDDQIRILTNPSNVEYLAMRSDVGLRNFLKESRDRYEDAKVKIIPDDYITIPYTRSRNPLAEESDSNDDDDSVPTSTNYKDLDLNKQEKIWKVVLPALSGGTLLNSDYSPMVLESYEARTRNELNSLIDISKSTINESVRISSTRQYDGFILPVFTPLLSTVTINYGSSGVTTSITESNMDIIPSDQSILMDRNRRIKSINSTFTKVNATRKNALKL